VDPQADPVLKRRKGGGLQNLLINGGQVEGGGGGWFVGLGGRKGHSNYFSGTS